MRRQAFILVAMLALVGAAVARADDGLTSTSNDVANLLSIDIAGNGNGLSIEQTFDRGGGGNRISAHITGDYKGLSGGTLAPALAATGLLPGQLVQAGHDNQIALTVDGSFNLFAVSQTGGANALTGSIIGNNNQAVILQIGSGNITSFSQAGTGNMLSVVQRSQ